MSGMRLRRQSNRHVTRPARNIEDASTAQRLMNRNYLVDVTLVKCAALLVSLLIPVAQTQAQTQAAMNAQARADFKQADAELNKTYQSVLAKLPTVENKQKLRQAQRAWVVSRDAEAARAAKEAEGGSMAPMLRYETMAELTQQRTKQLKTRLTDGAAPNEKEANTPTPRPTATSSTSTQGPDEKPAAAAPSARSVSPDKQWEYKCDEYYTGTCAPKLVKAGTGEVVLDLGQDLEVHEGEAGDAEVIWAADSKRFAFNYTPVHAHHTRVECVAFYQLRDGEWSALHSPSDEKTEGLQLAQLGKGHLPKDFNPRHCAPDNDVLKVRKWTDANTAILYAPCYGRTLGELEAGFVFTLKFGADGKWKIVKTHEMSKKELKEEQ